MQNILKRDLASPYPLIEQSLKIQKEINKGTVSYMKANKFNMNKMSIKANIAQT